MNEIILAITFNVAMIVFTALLTSIYVIEGGSNRWTITGFLVVVGLVNNIRLLTGLM